VSGVTGGLNGSGGVSNASTGNVGGNGGLYPTSTKGKGGSYATNDAQTGVVIITPTR
jgi:hypothetical protein